MYNSKNVTSNQLGTHQQLEKIVLKHIHSTYQKPFRKHNLKAFDLLFKKINSHSNSPLILDSCCGTAMSSILLAKANPQSLVVGIDQSFHRLNKKDINSSEPDNCILLQANCEDIWRLCVQEKIYFDCHYILYPNPWPKSDHFIRRWHGHPVFPYLMSLSKQIILRSNWNIYLEEFSLAWFLLSKQKHVVNEIDIDEPITLFEKKYSKSNQVIYELQID